MATTAEIKALAAEIRDRVGAGEFDDPTYSLEDLGDDGYEALAKLLLDPGLVSDMSVARVRAELEALYGPDGDSFYLFDEGGLEAATKLIVAMGIEREPLVTPTTTAPPPTTTAPPPTTTAPPTTTTAPPTTTTASPTTQVGVPDIGVARPVFEVAAENPGYVASVLMDMLAKRGSPISQEIADGIVANIIELEMVDIRDAVNWWMSLPTAEAQPLETFDADFVTNAVLKEFPDLSPVQVTEAVRGIKAGEYSIEDLRGLFAYLGRDTGVVGDGLPTGEELTSLLGSAVVSEYANQFGYYGSFLSHPQVGPILLLAAHEEWSRERLESVLNAPDVDFKKTLERLQELEGYGYDLDEFGLGQELMNFLLAYEGTGEDQSWWRTTAPTKRAWDMLLVSDPASAGVQLEAQMDLLRAEAGRLRMTISEARLETLATDAIVQGWDDTEIRRNLLAESQWDPGAAETGQIGANMTSIRGLIDRYMLTYEDDIVEDWARKIYLGEESLAVLEEDFKEDAKMNWPTLADKIDRGYTTRQLFSPYAQKIAGMLEMPASAIDFVNDPKYTPIIDWVAGDGERRAMTLSETGEYIRTSELTRPLWEQTDTAKTAAQSFADFIAKKFRGLG